MLLQLSVKASNIAGKPVSGSVRSHQALTHAAAVRSDAETLWTARGLPVKPVPHCPSQVLRADKNSETMCGAEV